MGEAIHNLLRGSKSPNPAVEEKPADSKRWGERKSSITEVRTNSTLLISPFSHPFTQIGFFDVK